MSKSKTLKNYISILESYKKTIDYNNGFLRDRQAISGDFNMVGRDIKIAIKKYEERKNKNDK